MRVIAIIPARLNSKRFPKKLLKKINGIPLILMTYQNLISMNIFDEIIVATDSEISNTIKKMEVKYILVRKNIYAEVTGCLRLLETTNLT